MTKVCKTCRVEKDLSEFRIHRDCRMGVTPNCANCLNAKSRIKTKLPEYVKRNRVFQRNYCKTFSGYMVRSYRNMKSRVTGVQKKKAHLYLGLEILPKRLYYKMCYESDTFRNLYEAYKASGWDRKLAPSPDRIDASRGYSLDNIRFVTHSENSARTSNNKVRKAA